MSPEDDSYHHGNLREALIDATTQLIGEESINAVSMRRLSDRLDVSRSAAYRHFDNKADLFAAVAKRGFNQLSESLQAVRNDPDDADVTETLLEMGKTYVRFALEKPAFYRLMFQWSWSDEQFQDLSAAGERTFDELVKAIEAGQAAGSFRDGSSDEMAFSTWALVHGIALLALEGHVPATIDEDETLESLLSWIGRGLLES